MGVGVGVGVGCSKSSFIISLFGNMMCGNVGLRSDMPSICLHTCCCECSEDGQFHHRIYVLRLDLASVFQYFPSPHF